MLYVNISWSCETILTTDGFWLHIVTCIGSHICRHAGGAKEGGKKVPLSRMWQSLQV